MISNLLEMTTPILQYIDDKFLELRIKVEQLVESYQVENVQHQQESFGTCTNIERVTADNSSSSLLHTMISKIKSRIPLSGNQENTVANQTYVEEYSTLWSTPILTYRTTPLNFQNIPQTHFVSGVSYDLGVKRRSQSSELSISEISNHSDEVEIAQDVLTTNFQESDDNIIDLHSYFDDRIEKYPNKHSEEFFDMIRSRADSLKNAILEFTETDDSIEYFIIHENLVKLIEVMDRIHCDKEDELFEKKVEIIHCIQDLIKQLEGNIASA